MNYKISARFCRLYIAILSFHIVYKAYVNSITTDEAYTYLEYVYTGDVFNIGVANNHILNTFSMFLTTFLGETEIFLRLPNVVAGLGYLLTVLVISQNNQFKILTVVVLTSPVYLIEYFTLARGYGISSFLIFFGCFNFYVLKRYKYSFLISTTAFLLSSLSIHIYIVFAGLFVLLNAKNEYFYNKRGFLISILLSIFFGYYVTTWTFIISQPGRPLFGAESTTFISLLKNGFGFVELFQTENIFSLVVVYILFLFPLFMFSSMPPEFKNLYLVTVLSLFFLFTLPIIFEKPFPIQRLLIPLLPPFLLTFVFSFENQFNLYPKFFNYLSVLFSIFLSLNLFLNLENKSTIDWGVGINKELLTCEEEALTDMRVRMAEYYRLLNKKDLTTICK